MTVAVGDVVMLATGLKYCVLSFVGNAHGGQDARLVRKNSDGSFTAFTKSADYLVPSDTPAFADAEKVTVNGLPGEFMNYEADGVARVMLAPRRRELPHGGFVEIEAAVCRVSRALLVLENRKL